MAQVIYTEPAHQDLDQTADYISLDNPAADKTQVAASAIENIHPTVIPK